MREAGEGLLVSLACRIRDESIGNGRGLVLGEHALLLDMRRGNITNHEALRAWSVSYRLDAW
jgi:hypothetical protein